MTDLGSCCKHELELLVSEIQATLSLRNRCFLAQPALVSIYSQRPAFSLTTSFTHTLRQIPLKLHLKLGQAIAQHQDF